MSSLQKEKKIMKVTLKSRVTILSIGYVIPIHSLGVIPIAIVEISYLAAD